MLNSATTIERLYRLDNYLRILAAELSLGLPTLSIISVTLLANLYSASVLLIASVVVLYFWIRWEFSRRRRRAAVFEVTRVTETFIHLGSRSRIWFFPPLTLRLTIVECSSRHGVAKYVDYDTRRVGEKLLLILDRKGRVLASAPLSKPVDVQILMRLN
jgi:hypothetical protein